MAKQVKYNRLNKDFDMFLNNRYVGSRPTSTEAQVELDRIAHDEAAR